MKFKRFKRLVNKENTLRFILIAGVLLRVVVFVFLEPQNNDDHHQVIDLIIQNRALPTSDQAGQAYHPPLYYLLALPWALSGSLKVIQVLSLLLSICNLYVLYRLIKNTHVLQDHGAKCHALTLVAILPQFVVFGNFLSNDTLSYLIGTLTFAQTFAYIRRPTRRNLVLIGVVLGAGLLTKGTFIAFVPVALVVGLFMGWRRGFTLKQHVWTITLICLVTGGIGAYKFVENTLHLGRPIIHNLDFNPWWRETQSGTYQGFSSLIDFNVLKLVHNPYIGEATRHSVPLLMYGTFWYAHIPESSFTVLRHNDWNTLPAVIYLAGLIPTFLIILGAVSKPWQALNLLKGTKQSDDTFVPQIQGTAAVLLLAANLAIVLAAGFRYDVWSCFQGRLLFPSIFAIALLFGWGYETACRKKRTACTILTLVLVLVYAILISYFVIEIGYAVLPYLSAR
jgi:4-amino-4-deoxy-L-arabinose transferase-like glycosyltransferase